jgi:class 3 adenylate cyclase
MSGLDVLKAIGRLKPEITRIILTGYATMEAAIAATNEGIDGFLTKPFDNVHLRASIRDIIVRKRLRQFVPEHVYRTVGAIEPRFHEATILFSDIRGFTGMCQCVSAQSLVGFLNDHYFTPLGEVAYRHAGTVDKHIGDSIMVVFGAPLVREDDTLRAVQAAIDMQRVSGEINARVAENNGLRLNVGIGIATGEVFSGVLGSLRRKEFTCIGMAVNVAARLQGIAAAGEILVSEPTFRKIRARIAAQPLPPVTVKGIPEPISAYRIV